MKAGKYLIMVSPIWNDNAEEHVDYKSIFVQLMAPEEVKINHLQADDGFEVFSQALKKHA